ncbi:MAG TPA: hypothetical protein VGG17_01965 [Acidimicrobiales bacterium]
MTATIAWIALLEVSLVIELRSRRDGRHVASLPQIGAWVAIRVLGRVIFWMIWIFVGLHLFARYGIDR